MMMMTTVMIVMLGELMILMTTNVFGQTGVMSIFSETDLSIVSQWKIMFFCIC